MATIDINRNNNLPNCNRTLTVT